MAFSLLSCNVLNNNVYAYNEILFEDNRYYAINSTINTLVDDNDQLVKLTELERVIKSSLKEGKRAIDISSLNLTFNQNINIIWSIIK